MSAIKTKATKVAVTSFLKTIKDEQKRADALSLLNIFTEVTGEKPVLWGNSMIGFGSYRYKSDRSTQEGDWPLTAFSPRAAGITIYIMPGFSEYGALLKKIGPHKISGGSCLYVKKLADIHIPTLKSLIKKSVVQMKKKYKV
ncbi:MAG TPA: DUF1801 domain-containing protein [Candidatus Paceibacterota bacterium]|nr:DUF1801 domain-containing protein [Candidatus Paceibacterota bacterium]HMO82582.1 DUF1801 domain-containing protein [Candidatus Paceibacterota bacterium]